jgi:tRNA threonylcarbamoyladenosine biosynthesis protein TsaE
VANRVVEFLSSLDTSRAKVVLLDGDLGAGKTTFTKELAGVLGIEREEVNSPTFILKKEYKATHSEFRKLVHIDAYRFLTKDEGRVLRLEEDIENPSTVIAIEWPEKMKHPKADIRVSFSVIDDDTREVGLEYDSLRQTMI